MVKHKTQPIDRTFAALADPTRRAILQRLTQSPALSVSELAAPFAMSLPGLMKHIDTLADAGLLAREKSGRTVYCSLNAAPMEDAMAWLESYEKFWTTRLDSLAAYLKDDPCPRPPSKAQQTQNPASPSSATSKPARKKSSRRGRKPRT